MPLFAQIFLLVVVILLALPISIVVMYSFTKLYIMNKEIILMSIDYIKNKFNN